MKTIWLKLLPFVCCWGCGTAHFSQSEWHTQHSDRPANFFHKRNELTLSVSNDTTNLYFDIESFSENTIRKIQDLGLSVWISKGNSPQKTYGIHYPLPYKNTKGQVALEGFLMANLVAMPVREIAPIQLKSSFLADKMHYSLCIPLSELGLTPTDSFTVELRSFEQGKQEYLSALTAAEAIEYRLDEYKANPQNAYNADEIIPFFATFQLAKMPNKNL